MDLSRTRGSGRSDRLATQLAIAAVTNGHTRGSLRPPASPGVELGAEGRCRVAGGCPGADEAEPRPRAPPRLAPEALRKAHRPPLPPRGPLQGLRAVAAPPGRPRGPHGLPPEGPLVGALNSTCKVASAAHLRTSLGVIQGTQTMGTRIPPTAGGWKRRRGRGRFKYRGAFKHRTGKQLHVHDIKNKQKLSYDGLPY